MSAFPQQTANTILCCLCGKSIRFNSAAMCDACIASEVDISEGIPKQSQLLWCKQCLRINRPPWVFADLESKELLAICLRTLHTHIHIYSQICTTDLTIYQNIIYQHIAMLLHLNDPLLPLLKFLVF